MKELTNAGVGTNVQRADPVLPSDEQKLWETGVFNSETAVGLSNIVFFYNCKLFGFRALDEHKDLDVRQYHFSVDTASNKNLHYTGRLCKNVQGGLDNRNIEVKRIVQKSDPGNPRCVVKIFEKYLSLIPKEGRFYRKPLPHKDNSNNPRFGVQPIGINTLSNKMKVIFQSAGIDTQDRRITNHSGKVTCCTTLFNAGYGDSVVKSRSGHRSTAVDSYKRPLEELQQNVSRTLQPPNPSGNSKTGNMDIKKTEENKENNTITENSNTITLNVPECVNRVVIVKNGKRFSMEI